MDYLFTVNLPSDTGLGKDTISNSWVMAGSAGSEVSGGNLGLAATALANFYNEPYTGALAADSVGHYLSPALTSSALAMEISTYELPAEVLDGEVNIGSPIWVNNFTLSRAPGGTALPSEVALKVTLEASGRAEAPVEGVGGTRPKQRHTGGCFIGPLGSNAVQLVSSIARPAPAFTLAVRENVRKLHQAWDGLANADGIGVWSRQDAIVRPITNVSTDDAFDTQRRRGESPTLRTRRNVVGA